MVSFSVVSEIAIVPDSEWRMPTLIVSSCACAGADNNRPAAIADADSVLLIIEKLPLMWTPPNWLLHRNNRCNSHASFEGARYDGDFTIHSQWLDASGLESPQDAVAEGPPAIVTILRNAASVA